MTISTEKDKKHLFYQIVHTSMDSNFNMNGESKVR